jgi:hypothetical protein
MTYRTTNPSRYYERQAEPKPEYPASPDYEAISVILAAAVFGFGLGIVVFASWFGAL